MTEPTDSRRASRPGLRFALSGLVLLALLAVAHTLLWRWMGSQLEAGFNAWTQARRAQGWQVEHGTPVRGGWPLAASLNVPNLHLTGGTGSFPGGIDWQAGTMQLRLRLPHIQTLVVDLPDAQRIATGFGDFSFAAERLEARLRLEPGIPPRDAEIIAERLRLGTQSGAVELQSLVANVDTRSTATEGEAAFTLNLQAEDATLPTPSPLGQKIESLSLDASLTGPVPPGREPRQRAEAWRDGGGTLEVQGMSLRWGPLGLSGAATMALDDQLQPMGAGTLRVTGIEALLDTLVASGAMPARTAGNIKPMLGLVMTRPADGGPPHVELPLTLERRSLSAMRLPLVKVPMVVWPSEPADP